MTRRHLTHAELLALALRNARLSPAATRHLAGCALCREEVEDFRLLREVAGEPATGPSPGALERASALFRPRAPRRADAHHFLRARLVWDSEPATAAASLRAPSWTLHQLWRTDVADVDVREERAGLGTPATLVGQVFPLRPSPESLAGNVWLVEPGRRPQWAALGPAGDFVFPAPARRPWALWLEWGAVRLRLEQR